MVTTEKQVNVVAWVLVGILMLTTIVCGSALYYERQEYAALHTYTASTVHDMIRSGVSVTRQMSRGANG